MLCECGVRPCAAVCGRAAHVESLARKAGHPCRHPRDTLQEHGRAEAHSRMPARPKGSTGIG
eukprot:1391126-Prymnesium_polylepis.1